VEPGRLTDSEALVVLTIVITMLAILVVAGLVVAYVAFPHRGEDLPEAPWLGESMGWAAEAVPTIEAPEEASRQR